MNLLLFFVSSLFSVIFYIFYLVQIWQDFLWCSFKSKISFNTFWDLYLEAIGFFIIWVFFLFFFSNFWFKWTSKQSDLDSILNEEDIENEKEEQEEELLQESIIIKQNIFTFIKDIFKKYNYYFAIILAYLSIFIILKSINLITIEIFILIVNVIVLILFTVWNKLFIFRDLVKINTIFFSIYYVIFFIIHIFISKFNFEFITFFNSFLVFTSFFINIYVYKKTQLNNDDSNILFYYFSFYSFIFISYYLNVIIWNLFLCFTIVSFFISVIIYFYFVRIIYLKDELVKLRTISLIFLYLSTLLSIFYSIFYWFHFIIISIMLYSIVINYRVHYLFENYTSFLFSIFNIIFIIYFFIFNDLFFYNDWLLLLILGLWLSIEVVIFTYFYKMKYLYDNHFLHFFSYLNSFFIVIYYFFYFRFDFFNLWIILLILSIYIFSSFYKLKSLKARK